MSAVNLRLEAREFKGKGFFLKGSVNKVKTICSLLIMTAARLINPFTFLSQEHLCIP